MNFSPPMLFKGCPNFPLNSVGGDNLDYVHVPQMLVKGNFYKPAEFHRLPMK
jgi:hypothetical protein